MCDISQSIPFKLPKKPLNIIWTLFVIQCVKMQLVFGQGMSNCGEQGWQNTLSHPNFSIFSNGVDFSSSGYPKDQVVLGYFGQFLFHTPSNTMQTNIDEINNLKSKLNIQNDDGMLIMVKDLMRDEPVYLKTMESFPPYNSQIAIHVDNESFIYLVVIEYDYIITVTLDMQGNVFEENIYENELFAPPFQIEYLKISNQNPVNNRIRVYAAYNKDDQPQFLFMPIDFIQETNGWPKITLNHIYVEDLYNVETELFNHNHKQIYSDNQQVSNSNESVELWCYFGYTTPDPFYMNIYCHYDKQNPNIDQISSPDQIQVIQESESHEIDIGDLVSRFDLPLTGSLSNSGIYRTVGSVSAAQKIFQIGMSVRDKKDQWRFIFIQVQFQSENLSEIGGNPVISQYQIGPHVNYALFTEGFTGNMMIANNKVLLQFNRPDDPRRFFIGEFGQAPTQWLQIQYSNTSNSVAHNALLSSPTNVQIIYNNGNFYTTQRSLGAFTIQGSVYQSQFQICLTCDPSNQCLGVTTQPEQSSPIILGNFEEIPVSTMNTQESITRSYDLVILPQGITSLQQQPASQFLLETDLNAWFLPDNSACDDFYQIRPINNFETDFTYVLGQRQAFKIEQNLAFSQDDQNKTCPVTHDLILQETKSVKPTLVEVFDQSLGNWQIVAEDIQVQIVSNYGEVFPSTHSMVGSYRISYELYTKSQLREISFFNSSEQILLKISSCSQIVPLTQTESILLFIGSETPLIISESLPFDLSRCELANVWYEEAPLQTTTTTASSNQEQLAEIGKFSFDFLAKKWTLQLQTSEKSLIGIQYGTVRASILASDEVFVWNYTIQVQERLLQQTGQTNEEETNNFTKVVEVDQESTYDASDLFQTELDEPKSEDFLKILVAKVDSFGILELRFDKPIIKLDVVGDSDQTFQEPQRTLSTNKVHLRQLIEFTIDANEQIERQANLLAKVLQVNLVEQADYFLRIGIDFVNKDQITLDLFNPEFLQLKIKDSKYFVAQDSFERIESNLELRVALPQQKDAQKMINLVETAQLVGNSLKAACIITFLANILLGKAMKSVWNMTYVLQIAAYTIDWNINLTDLPTTLLRQFKILALFEFMNASQIRQVAQVLLKVDCLVTQEGLRALVCDQQSSVARGGSDGVITVIGSGNFFLDTDLFMVVLLAIFASLILLVLLFVCSKGSQRIGQVYNRVKQKLLWSPLLRFLIQSYIKMPLAALQSLRAQPYNLKGFAVFLNFSVSFQLILLATYTLSPVLNYKILAKNRNNLRNEASQSLVIKKFTPLVQGLNVTKRKIRYFMPLYGLYCLLFTLICSYLIKHPSMQMILTLEMTLVKLLILVELNVYEDWHTRRLAIWNEIFLMGYLIMASCLSNFFFIENAFSKEFISFSGLAFLVAVLVMNFSAIFSTIFEQSRLKYTKKQRYIAYLQKRAEIQNRETFADLMLEKADKEHFPFTLSLYTFEKQRGKIRHLNRQNSQTVHDILTSEQRAEIARARKRQIAMINGIGQTRLGGTKKGLTQKSIHQQQKPMGTIAEEDPQNSSSMTSHASQTCESSAGFEENHNNRYSSEAHYNHDFYSKSLQNDNQNLTERFTKDDRLIQRESRSVQKRRLLQPQIDKQVLQKDSALLLYPSQVDDPILQETIGRRVQYIHKSQSNDENLQAFEEDRNSVIIEQKSAFKRQKIDLQGRQVLQVDLDIQKTPLYNETRRYDHENLKVDHRQKQNRHERELAGEKRTINRFQAKGSWASQIQKNKEERHKREKRRKAQIEEIRMNEDIFQLEGLRRPSRYN